VKHVALEAVKLPFNISRSPHIETEIFDITVENDRGFRGFQKYSSNEKDQNIICEIWIPSPVFVNARNK
jgi:hypothetical protein